MSLKRTRSYNQDIQYAPTPYKPKKRRFLQTTQNIPRPLPLRTAGPERKTFDVVPGVAQVNTTGFVQVICVPTLGNDYVNRVGRKITIKSVFIKGYIRTEISLSLAAANATSQAARVLLVYDDQPNGALATVTDILNSADPASQLNLNNRDRFRILKEKFFVFDPYLGAAFAGRQIYPIKIFKRLNLDVTFNGVNGGTIADIQTGALLMVYIGSNAAGVNTDINAYLSSRVRFLDM